MERRFLLRFHVKGGVKLHAGFLNAIYTDNSKVQSILLCTLISYAYISTVTSFTTNKWGHVIKFRITGSSRVLTTRKKSVFFCFPGLLTQLLNLWSLLKARLHTITEVLVLCVLFVFVFEGVEERPFHCP